MMGIRGYTRCRVVGEKGSARSRIYQGEWNDIEKLAALREEANKKEEEAGSQSDHRVNFFVERD